MVIAFGPPSLARSASNPSLWSLAATSPTQITSVDLGVEDLLVAAQKYRPALPFIAAQ
jgi:hypothetical protein